MLRVSKFEYKLNSQILIDQILSIWLYWKKKKDQIQFGSSMGFLVALLIIILLYVQTIKYDQCEWFEYRINQSHFIYDQN